MPEIIHVDYLIIGAGPAGLQLGYYFEKARRNYLILEAGEKAGTFFTKFPRHRQLISINKVYTGYSETEINLRWDWNSLLSDNDNLLFKNYSEDYFPEADALITYLEDYASYYKIKVKYNTCVVEISKDELFRIQDDNGNQYTCKRLIVATGLFKPYLPSIPGIELTENYTTVNINPKDFINQQVLVIGKGNSGFETADNLIGTTSLLHVASPEPLNLAWKSHFVGHLRAVNNNILDTYQLKSQNAIIDATIERIRRHNGRYVVSVRYSHANGEKEDLVYDRVICCTGFRFDTSIFDDSCMPQLTINDRFPDQTSEWESTTVKHLYFAGTLTQMRDYKKTTSGFLHGFRYNVQALHRIFETKYHDCAWPSKLIHPSADSLVRVIIERVNYSSALWQQFGFLCDLIVLPKQSQYASYFKEMPVDYIHEHGPGRDTQFYTISLEFGKIIGDPFNVTRDPTSDQAFQSTFLHPVIRCYVNGSLLDEHHILEDLYAEWLKEDAHIKPLYRFIASTLQNPHQKVVTNGTYDEMSHAEMTEVSE